MSINSLLYDHQLAVLRAQHATFGADNGDLRNQADLFALRIADWRRTECLPTIGWPGHSEALDRDETLPKLVTKVTEAIAP